MLVFDDDALRRVPELDAEAAELADDTKIDGVLQVQHGIELGLLCKIG